MAVHNRLKEIMEEQGRKQVWLERKANISRTTVNNALKNKTVTLEVAFKIAKAFNCDINDIFYYVETE